MGSRLGAHLGWTLALSAAITLLALSPLVLPGGRALDHLPGPLAGAAKVGEVVAAAVRPPVVEEPRSRPQPAPTPQPSAPTVVAAAATPAGAAPTALGSPASTGGSPTPGPGATPPPANGGPGVVQNDGQRRQGVTQPGRERRREAERRPAGSRNDQTLTPDEIRAELRRLTGRLRAQIEDGGARVDALTKQIRAMPKHSTKGHQAREHSQDFEKHIWKSFKQTQKHAWHQPKATEKHSWKRTKHSWKSSRTFEKNVKGFEKNATRWFKKFVPKVGSVGSQAKPGKHAKLHHAFGKTGKRHSKRSAGASAWSWR